MKKVEKFFTFFLSLAPSSFEIKEIVKFKKNHDTPLSYRKENVCRDRSAYTRKKIGKIFRNMSGNMFVISVRHLFGNLFYFFLSYGVFVNL